MTNPQQPAAPPSTNPPASPRIDGAVHVWSGDSASFPWSPLDGVEAPSSGAPAPALLETLEAAGFQGAVCVQPRAYGYDHRYLREIVASHPGRLAGVCLVDPRSAEGPARLREFVRESGFAGLRLVPLGHEDASWLDGPSGDALWDAAVELGVPVSVLAAPDQLRAVLARARRTPAATLVLEHLGLVTARLAADRLDLLLDCAAAENVVVKVSALPELSGQLWPYSDLAPIVDAVIAEFGPDRVVFGTDWPHALDHGPWDDARRAIVDDWGLAMDAHEGLFGANAARLWRLDPAAAVA